MENSDVEKTLIKLNADIIDIKARMQALQNTFFGMYSAENEKDVSDGLKKLFLDFYDENLRKSINELPDGPARQITHHLLLQKEK